MKKLTDINVIFLLKPSYPLFHHAISLFRFIFIISEWERIGCSSRTIYPAAVFDYRCWSSFLGSRYYSYDALTHEECKYKISTLFMSFKSRIINFREKEIFEKRRAKIAKFLFLQGKSSHKVLRLEWLYCILRKKLYFYHF